MSGLGKWIIFSEDFAQKCRIFLCMEKENPSSYNPALYLLQESQACNDLPDLCTVCVVRQERCSMQVHCLGEFQVW